MPNCQSHRNVSPNSTAVTDDRKLAAGLMAAFFTFSLSYLSTLFYFSPLKLNSRSLTFSSTDPPIPPHIVGYNAICYSNIQNCTVVIVSVFEGSLHVVPY